MNNQDRDYSSWQLEDFLDDPGFVSWVLVPNQSNSIYWNNVHANFPAQSEVISSARQLILAMRFESMSLTPADQAELWLRIDHDTSDPKTPFIIPLWLRATAAAVLLVTVGIGAWLFMNGLQKYSTNYGQIVTVILPDGSPVTLNAHSNIRYAAKWKTGEKREVWLEGEALFKIKHQSGRFIVHADQTLVEDQGTEFTVNERRGQVKVSLVSGRISFTAGRSSVKTIFMRPGEILQYISIKDTIIKRSGDTSQFAGWKSGRLYFDHTPIIKVFEYIEDTYGDQVVVKQPDILKKTLSGNFMSTKEDDFIRAIGISLGITIRRSQASQLIVQY